MMMGLIYVVSDQYVVLMSGVYMSIGVGKSMLVSVQQVVCVVVFEKGIWFVVVVVDIDIQVLKDSVNVFVKLDVKVDVNCIIIIVKEEVLINGGISYMCWNGSGIVYGIKGEFIVYVVLYMFIGLDSLLVFVCVFLGMVCVLCMVNVVLMVLLFVVKV